MPSIQSDFKTIGVTLSLAEEDTQINYQDLRMANFQIGSAGWIADYNDAMNFLYLQRSSTDALNYGGYKNLVYDKLLDEADNEPDGAKRAAEMRQAEAIMLSDQPITPMTFQTNTDLVNPRITGWVDNIVDQHRSRYLCVRGAKGPPYR